MGKILSRTISYNTFTFYQNVKKHQCAVSERGRTKTYYKCEDCLIMDLSKTDDRKAWKRIRSKFSKTCNCQNVIILNIDDSVSISDLYAPGEAYHYENKIEFTTVPEFCFSLYGKTYEEREKDDTDNLDIFLDCLQRGDREAFFDGHVMFYLGTILEKVVQKIHADAAYSNREFVSNLTEFVRLCKLMDRNCVMVHKGTENKPPTIPEEQSESPTPSSSKEDEDPAKNDCKYEVTLLNCEKKGGWYKFTRTPLCNQLESAINPPSSLKDDKGPAKNPITSTLKRPTEKSSTPSTSKRSAKERKRLKIIEETPGLSRNDVTKETKC